MYLTKIVLENSFQASRDMHSLGHDVTKPAFSNGVRLLNFSLKILVIKLSAKLSELSISLTRWIKAFLLRVVKVFYRSRDLLFRGLQPHGLLTQSPFGLED